jgi:hypothetical protein
MSTSSITQRFYDAFQKAEFGGFDQIVSSDVVINSPMGYGLRGRDTLKDWAGAFVDSLGYKIDLVDEHLDLDAGGNGRGFIIVTLHWAHQKEFFGVAPSAARGTSVETLIFTVKGNQIVRIDVADNTLDLVLYFASRNWDMPKQIVPPAIREGIDRR